MVICLGPCLCSSWLKSESPFSNLTLQKERKKLVARMNIHSDTRKPDWTHQIVHLPDGPWYLRRTYRFIFVFKFTIVNFLKQKKICCLIKLYLRLTQVLIYPLQVPKMIQREIYDTNLKLILSAWLVSCVLRLRWVCSFFKKIQAKVIYA